MSTIAAITPDHNMKAAKWSIRCGFLYFYVTQQCPQVAPATSLQQHQTGKQTDRYLLWCQALNSSVTYLHHKIKNFRHSKLHWATLLLAYTIQKWKQNEVAGRGLGTNPKLSAVNLDPVVMMYFMHAPLGLDTVKIYIVNELNVFGWIMAQKKPNCVLFWAFVYLQHTNRSTVWEIHIYVQPEEQKGIHCCPQNKF